MARAGLAGRSDLPQSIGRALASLGSASVALPQPARAEVEEPGPAVAVGQAASESAADSGSSQISELVRRIDKYQSTRRSEEHTSELQSLMRNSYAVFCLNIKNTNTNTLTKKH